MIVEGESDSDGNEGRRGGDDLRRRRQITVAPRLSSSGRDLPCGDHDDAEAETASIRIEDEGKEEGAFSSLPSVQHAGAVEVALLGGIHLHAANSIANEGYSAEVCTS